MAAEPAPQSPSPSPETTTEASPRSSGSFPAVTNAKKRIPPLVPPPTSPDEDTSSVPSKNQPQDNNHSKGSKHVWLYVVIAVASFIGLLIIVAVIFLCRKRAVKSIGPWKTGLSGQLQKAFVTGKKVLALSVSLYNTLFLIGTLTLKLKLHRGTKAE